MPMGFKISTGSYGGAGYEGDMKKSQEQDVVVVFETRRWPTAAVSVACILIGFVYTIIAVVAANVLDPILDNTHRVALLFHIFIFVLFIMSGLVGLYGTLRSKRKPISFFFSFIFSHLLISIASGAFLLYLLYSPKSSNPTSDDPNEQPHGPVISMSPGGKGDVCSVVHGGFAKGLCERSPALKGMAPVALIFGWLFDIGSLVVVNRFSRRLLEEDTIKTEKEVWDGY